LHSGQMQRAFEDFIFWLCINFEASAQKRRHVQIVSEMR
jgi:hypothetical protein